MPSDSPKEQPSKQKAMHSRLLQFLNAQKENVSAIHVFGTLIVLIGGALLWSFIGVRYELSGMRTSIREDVLAEARKEFDTFKQTLSSTNSDAKATSQHLESLVWLLQLNSGLDHALCRADYSNVITQFARIKLDPRFLAAKTDRGEAHRLRQRAVLSAITSYSYGGRFAGVDDSDFELFREVIREARDEACSLTAHYSYCTLLVAARRFDDGKREILAGFEQLALTKPRPAGCAGCGAIGDEDTYSQSAEGYVLLLVVLELASHAQNSERRSFHKEGELIDIVCRKLSVNSLSLDYMETYTKRDFAPLIRHLSLRESTDLGARIASVTKEWIGLRMVPVVKSVKGAGGKEQVDRVYMPVKIVSNRENQQANEDPGLSPMPVRVK
jgi:hypothetical protein